MGWSIYMISNLEHSLTISTLFSVDLSFLAVFSLYSKFSSVIPPMAKIAFVHPFLCMTSFPNIVV